MQRLSSITLCCLCLLAGAPGLAHAGEGYSLDVHESLITSLAGKFSGQTFTSTYAVREPFGKNVLYRGTVTATVGRPTFSVTPSGVDYAVRVVATLSAPKPFSPLSTSFTAYGHAAVTAGAREVSFSGDTVSIPIRLYIPVINTTVTIYTITTQLPFRVSVPLRAGRLVTTNDQALYASPTNLTVHYLNDWIRVTGDVDFQ